VVSTHDLPTRDLPDGTRARRDGPPAKVPEEDVPEDELAHGDFVGRYSVLSCLGRGGMGVVYKAYDPQLDRNVALKLLRRGRSSVTADLRLLREAQTLAKLKHPNVVAVYDAGLTNHGVFIAMELLAGKTVNEWIEQKTRSVAEILAVFRAAGRGLLAAHDAGFVHRDFKPSNVLVEDDGSVRVVDFGLAHLLDDPSSPGLRATGPQPSPHRDRSTDEERSGPPHRSSREVFATEAGLVIGTPAFMAPEQIVGDRGDHRSEQFAFAMSLYVSLYDRSPLAGETYEERRENIVRGLRISERDLERSASGEYVPPRIRQAILRGLASGPSERFGSMAELLAQLEEPPKRWRLAVVAAFTLLAGFGVGAMVFDEPSDSPCLRAAAALEGTWGPADRAAVESAFAAADANGSLPRVTAQLDAYATAWVAMHTSSCRATFVTHQQSERLFDQRMRCLDRRRNRLRSVIDALVEAQTPEVLVDRTILPFKLPGLEACADLEAVAVEQPLPEDPAARDRIAALRERLDRADTCYDMRDFAQGLELTTAAVAAARDLDHPPVLAEALVSLGRMQNMGASADDAETALREAILVAADVGDARTEAVAWIELLFSHVVQGKAELGVAQQLAAQAAVARAHDAVMESWLLNNLGVVYSEHGDPERSRDYLRQALEAKQRTLGPGHVDVGGSWYNLGNSLVDYELYEPAREAFEHARTIFEATVGQVHPMFHYAKSGLCRVEQAQGHAAAAVKLCGEVLGYLEASHPSPTWLYRVGFTLAQAQWDAGRLEQARATAARARERASVADPLTKELIDRWLADPVGFERNPAAKDEPSPTEGPSRPSPG
jgi:eukaryotic-like serine/threonine-protein kinase